MIDEWHFSQSITQKPDCLIWKLLENRTFNGLENSFRSFWSWSLVILKQTILRTWIEWKNVYKAWNFQLPYTGSISLHHPSNCYVFFWNKSQVPSPLLKSTLIISDYDSATAELLSYAIIILSISFFFIQKNSINIAIISFVRSALTAKLYKISFWSMREKFA